MNWLRNMTIKKRLITTSAALVVLVFTYGAFSLLSMERLGGLTALLYEHPLQVSNAAQRADTGVIKMHRSMKDVALAQSRTDVILAMQEVQQEEKVVLGKLAIIDELILGEEGQALAREARQLLMDWRPIRAEVLTLVDGGKSVEAALITKGRGADHVAVLEGKMQELTAYAGHKADGFMENANSVRLSTLWTSIAALVVLVLCAGGVTLLLANSILTALNRLRHTMADISSTGQLKMAEVEGRHEISDMTRHFNSLVETLQTQLDHREGLNDLSQQLTVLPERDALNDMALNQLARQVGACVGALYLYDEKDGVCELSASFARVEHGLLGARYGLGESVVGQVAKEQKAILLTDLSASEASGVTGTLSEPVQALYAVPLVHQQNLIGVLEVASFLPFPEPVIAYIDEAADVIAAWISGSQKEQRIRQLLASTQDANSLLETRGQEIEAANSELTQANVELKAQTQELAAQTEELRAQKLELERQRSRVAETDRLKTEFLSNMSHELRTPLNSILALSQLMLSRGIGVDPEKEKEYLGVVERNGRHLLALINDILDLSKIEAGRMELNLGTIAPLTFLQEVVATVKPLAAEKGLLLTVDGDVADEMYGDKNKLRQILLNLLSNAVKFTDTGSVRVRTWLDGTNVRFEVHDTGVGIPTDQQAHVFDQFRQVDGATTRRFEGTGLGLAICQRLAEMMGGEIQLESSEGGGSTFCLILPLRLEERPKPEMRKKRPLAASVEPAAVPLAGPSDKRGKVLVVDDEEEVRRLLRQFLEGAGYAVEVATNGREALTLAAATKPDCITLDILMPEMDGWEVIRQLKDEETTSDIPVVIVSLSDDQATGFALGASGYVLKPIDRNLLLETLGNLALTHPIKRVLVIDDDPIVREHLDILLSELDYEVDAAEGGQQGLDRLAQGVYDAVILDLMMPEVDGFTVADRIKSDPNLQHLPIIILSAKDLSSMDQTLLQPKVHQIIGKGQMDRPALLDKLDRTLQDLVKPPQRRQILVVEDNEVAQLQIETALQSAGYQVEVTDDGMQAIERISANPPSALLVDLMMPGMDGFEVIARVRELDQGRDLPILVLTAKDMTEEDHDQLRTGLVRQLVQKGSLNREELIRCVGQLFVPEEPKAIVLNETPPEMTAETVVTPQLGRKVLVVEDNPDNRLTIEALLSERGYEFHTLVDGSNAIEQAKAFQPGVVLMDMQLPDIDGLELTRRFKQDPEVKAIPIVAITAHAMHGDREGFLAQGCDDYLSKPLNADHLYTTLEKWLQ